MNVKIIIRAAAVAAFLSGGLIMSQPGAVWAQDAAKPAASPTKPAASPAKPSAMPKASMTPDEKKARSKECSDKADTQKLTGSARKKFRSKCKRGKA
jgi:hypothetical protein